MQSTHPVRVLLLIPQLQSGGAARVSTHVAQGLAEHGHEIHLAALTGAAPSADHARPYRVHHLGSTRLRWGLWRLITLIRELHPQIILSNVTHLNLAVLALRRLLPPGVRIIARHDGGVHPERLSPVRRSALRRLYASSDAIVCQSDAMKVQLDRFLGSAHLLQVLANPVVPAPPAVGSGLRPGPNHDGPNLIAVGRLVHHKGFDLLLRAFAAIAPRHPESRLTLVGEGPERETLAALAQQLGIASRAHFAGNLSDARTCFSSASAFVLSSREDALPNALLEAAAAGLPIVATPALGGIPDLLKHQPGVWMSRDISAPALAITLSAALDALHPGQHFEHAWLKPHHWANAIAAYDHLVRTVAGSGV